MSTYLNDMFRLIYMTAHTHVPYLYTRLSWAGYQLLQAGDWGFQVNLPYFYFRNVVQPGHVHVNQPTLRLANIIIFGRVLHVLMIQQMCLYNSIKEL